MPPVPVSLSRSPFSQGGTYNNNPPGVAMSPESSVMSNGNRYHSGGYVVRGSTPQTTHTRGWYNHYAPHGEKKGAVHSHSASPRSRHPSAAETPFASLRPEGRAKSEAYQPRGSSPPPVGRGNLGNLGVPPLFGGDRPVRDVMTPSFLGGGGGGSPSPYPGNAGSREMPAWMNPPRFAAAASTPRVGSTDSISTEPERSTFHERYSRLTREPSPVPPKRVFSSPPPSFRNSDDAMRTPRGRSTDKAEPSSPGTPAGGGPIRFTGGSNRRPSMLWDGASEYIIQGQADEDRGKYCVVLDLDETLVFARNGPIQLRPGCKELIRVLGEHCETVVWTAGERSYAKEVLSKIDDTGAIRHCVYRHHLWFNGKAGQVKDLRLLGRDPDRVLLVENTPDCLRKNATQSLLVPDFRGTDTSSTLFGLADVLRGMIRSDMSVSQYLRQSPLIAPRQVVTNVGDTIFVHTLSGGTDADFHNRAPNPDTTHGVKSHRPARY